MVTAGNPELGPPNEPLPKTRVIDVVDPTRTCDDLPDFPAYGLHYGMFNKFFLIHENETIIHFFNLFS